ncbi:MAG TPA: HlyD family efflux transporter periplasmic adaptor subunit [Kofleriaceae bacterium]|jgi:biotin carboxyl carrier protein
MRSHSNVDMSTTRKASPRVQSQVEWGPAADAPTFLPKEEMIELSRRSRSEQAPHARPTLREADKRVKSDSVVTSAPRPSPIKLRTEPASRPAPLPEPPSAPRKPQKQANKARPITSSQPSSSKSAFSGEINSPAQLSESSQPSARGSQPSQPSQPRVAQAPQQQAPQQPQPQPQPQRPSTPELPGGGAPFVQFPNGGAAFDPLALPLPPELAPQVFGWLRRLALQADLAGADRLLRDALAELTSALSVIIIYAGPDGFYTLGPDEEVPKDPNPVIAVGKARRALVSTHTALVPIVNAAETIAVIQLMRNPRQPAFGPAEYIAMAAIGRESTSVMHHLVVEHLTHKTELARDKGSLYRPEALEHHRKRGTEGVAADLSPRWVRSAYPMLLISVVTAIAFAFFVKIPTYSTGQGIIEYEGDRVIAPAPGNIVEVLVSPEDLVKKGAAIAKLSAGEQEAELHRADTEDQIAIASYLFDSNDEQVRKGLAAAHVARRRAQEALDQRTIRSPRDGMVKELFAQKGNTVGLGDSIAVVSDPDAKPFVWAMMPGNDISRLEPMMHKNAQIELAGYQKTREHGTITKIAKSAIGAGQVRKGLGGAFEGTLATDQKALTYTEVHIDLPSADFHYHGKTLHFTAGQMVKVEIKLEEKRFLFKLLPDLSHLGG